MSKEKMTCMRAFDRADIECPHCGHILEPANGYLSETGEWDCLKCREPFYIQVEITARYTVSVPWE